MPSNDDSSKSSTSDDKTMYRQEDFLCGVVEGFYGRPWTTDQRKDLFTKMQEWGMNSYLYAPKDDCKHRAYWRELYTVEEAEHLQSLISLAKECNIDFYYAISPGLDITYSSPKEISSLKRKLEQVSQLGCNAFALLFDDIEPDMCKSDKEVFQSFAQAQVTVTNDVFQHLNHPKFLFCPTQYCTARAVPSVRNSEYLNTIGAKLAPDIKIMWTGDKVISKLITIETLEDITEVLKRPCVIWDNEHANDYDQKRVYLGPYSGRSPDIIPKLAGVMTNPNCEYGANFVGVHTLAQWSKCRVDGTAQYGGEAVSADIKLEIQSNENSELSPLPPEVYHPRNALDNAIRDWVKEFARAKNVWGPMSKPQIGLTPPTLLPSVNTCMSYTTTTSMIKSQIQQKEPSEDSASEEPPPPEPHPDHQAELEALNVASPTPDSSQVAMDPNIDPADTSAMNPISLPVMNSLVSEHKVVVDTSLVDVDHPMVPAAMNVLPESVTIQPPTLAESSTNLEPMEIAGKAVSSDSPMESITNPPTPASAMQVEPDSNLHKAESTTMLCDPCSESQPPPPPNGPAHSNDVTADDIMPAADAIPNDNMICDDDALEMTSKDLLLLCQLFYLPSEHGQIGLELLNDFFWLKRNACAMLPAGSEGAGSLEDRNEWQTRSVKFHEMITEIERLFVKLCRCPNRELVYDLYTYLWDMCGVVQTLDCFVEWLAKGASSPKLPNYVLGQQTWFSGVREAFVSGEHEPWVFRGGLVSDLQRLLPLDSANDLYIYKYPDLPTNTLYRIRPFRPSDQATIYALATEAFEETTNVAPGMYAEHRDLVGDKTIGSFLTLCPDYAFVCESTADDGVVAYITGTPDAFKHYKHHNMAWLPEMRAKYTKIDKDMLTPAEEMAQGFHASNAEWEFPECLQPTLGAPPAQQPWGAVKLHVAQCMNEPSISKRLVMAMLACLRASGTVRCFVEIPSGDLRLKNVYIGLGFHPFAFDPTAPSTASPTTEFVCLTRNF